MAQKNTSGMIAMEVVMLKKKYDRLKKQSEYVRHAEEFSDEPTTNGTTVTRTLLLPDFLGTCIRFLQLLTFAITVEGNSTGVYDLLMTEHGPMGVLFLNLIGYQGWDALISNSYHKESRIDFYRLTGLLIDALGTDHYLTEKSVAFIKNALTDAEGGISCSETITDYLHRVQYLSLYDSCNHKRGRTERDCLTCDYPFNDHSPVELVVDEEGVRITGEGAFALPCCGTVVCKRFPLNAMNACYLCGSPITEDGRLDRTKGEADDLCVRIRNFARCLYFIPANMELPPLPDDMPTTDLIPRSTYFSEMTDSMYRPYLVRDFDVVTTDTDTDTDTGTETPTDFGSEELWA